ncbi:hypothetical protein BDU57DRAFT_289795 [Ampelomyces quisqualis]|uniref:Transmembrane protein n=1 Tax=Ampelomyces quisqualis TaxID=50730 RepID=A0A6A5QHW5_AMPQU|nr:hypothetical protein BDU57DRAFT_289795 [Ampelomyces quisqualis]
MFVEAVCGLNSVVTPACDVGPRGERKSRMATRKETNDAFQRDTPVLGHNALWLQSVCTSIGTAKSHYMTFAVPSLYLVPRSIDDIFCSPFPLLFHRRHVSGIELTSRHLLLCLAYISGVLLRFFFLFTCLVLVLLRTIYHFR